MPALYGVASFLKEKKGVTRCVWLLFFTLKIIELKKKQRIGIEMWKSLQLLKSIKAIFIFVVYLDESAFWSQFSTDQIIGKVRYRRYLVLVSPGSGIGKY